jgi:hypothetical protein
VEAIGSRAALAVQASDRAQGVVQAIRHAATVAETIERRKPWFRPSFPAQSVVQTIDRRKAGDETIGGGASVMAAIEGRGSLTASCGQRTA